VIGLLQMIPAISTSDGKPMIFIPLVIIILITALKDLFEDLKRHQADNEENNRPVEVYCDETWQTRPWMDILVGQLVKVKRNEYFPADMLILSSSEAKGVCYIETKNLDGETNLKHKYAHKDLLKEMPTNLKKLASLELVMRYEKPNPYLYQFTGSIQKGSTKIPLDSQHFVLRGCSLRNTDWIIGLVGYSGHHTKIMLNSVKARAKISRVEATMNRCILSVFIVQIFICILSAGIYVGWYGSNKVHA
jgi:phospholipid-transporting ATPase